ncbi:hypothetical protein [Candidatus Thiosymbion oneisti]|uniref:hypothetical protein n=1 Tax=Candidatus Thiosymbion oneisti TaxID=589554 RepID=UPI0013FDFC8E|nr:hypothetical protein [Candidatus Thiosymbion oneisti]
MLERDLGTCLFGEFSTVKRIDHKLLIVAAMTIALSGCQTTNDTQDNTVGVGIAGMVVGSITGALTNATVGTAVSVATGLAAFTINNYQSKLVSSTAEERRAYGATGPVTQPQVKIQKSRNTPTVVEAGGKVAVRTVYWLNLPPRQSTAPVVESWTIKDKDDIALVTLGPTSGGREKGKRETTLDFTVPEEIKPGTYMIEHKVQTGSRSDTGISKFYVIE